MVKILAVKMFSEKAALQGLAKKLWRMLTCIANEYNKTNSIFSKIYLVLGASSMLFDDCEVNCNPYLSRIYKQTIV